MKLIRTTLPLAAAVMLLWAGFGRSQDGKEPTPKLRWLTDLEAARQQAAAQRRPLLVVFR